MFTAHELPYDHSQRIALETNLITDSYDTPPKRLENHESYLVCPGKQTVKIGANYPVSIHIFFHNFVRRTNNTDDHREREQHAGDNGDIYLHITDEGFHDNYHNAANNQQNNRINVRELMKKRENAIKGRSGSDNKSSDADVRINIIESNQNIGNINEKQAKH